MNQQHGEENLLQYEDCERADEGVCRGRSLKEVMRIVGDEIEKGRFYAAHPQNERDI